MDKRLSKIATIAGAAGVIVFLVTLPFTFFAAVGSSPEYDPQHTYFTRIYGPGPQFLFEASGYVRPWVGITYHWLLILLATTFGVAVLGGY